MTEDDEVDATGKDFRSGPNPHTRPPDAREFGVVNVPPQVPGIMDIVERRF